MIMAQVHLPGSDADETVKIKTIPRKKMEDHSKPVKFNVPHEKYDGHLQC